MTGNQLVEIVSLKKQRRHVHILRVGWHDTRALLNEFRKPLFVFFFALFVGGFVYWYLNNTFSDNEALDLIDMPYYMLAFMVLESPLEVPEEPYLIVFWYVMPLVTVYVVGRGAADFLRLFIDREQRGGAWEVAVASTFRRHIIVVGIGHTGMRIVRELRQMGFEVVAVDSDINKDAHDRLHDLDVPLIAGDARNEQVLQSARLDHAMAAIICTSDDYVNLEVAMRMRAMNENTRLVTRMSDKRLPKKFECHLKVEVLSTSDLAASAFAGAAVGAEIMETLHIAGLEYSMIRFIVRQGSFMDGATVSRIQEKEGVDIVLLHRENGGAPDVHPDGQRILKAGDTIVLFAHHDRITEILGRNEKGRC
ncbi:MAG: NAD-binding protein [Chloroflexi bacterium]|nr:NAD-binding protein [Chloroflexota bacterium]